jgi:hypothetical protein
MAGRPTKIVRLTDETDAESWIKDRGFEQSLILGPAVCATTGTTFIRCAFVGPPSSMLIEIPDEQRLQGIVGLSNVTFTDCVFQDVAFIGNAREIASLRAAMEAGHPQPEAESPQPVPAHG